MQPSKPAGRTALRERNHVPRQRVAESGNNSGSRPLYLAIAMLTVFALAWFLYGWWTYPTAS
jgi:hypothetical protein